MVQKLRLACAGACRAELDDWRLRLPRREADGRGLGRVPSAVDILVEWRRVGKDIKKAVQHRDAKSVSWSGIVETL